MGVYTIKRGLNLPIAGAPEQRIHTSKPCTHVALLADDYIGMKPTMFVRPGDAVKRGQPLFEDKKTPGVIFTSPGAGKVTSVNRGDRRALQSVVIELSASERDGEAGTDDLASFQNYSGRDIAGLSRDEIRALLVESGLWTAFRTRPFSRTPAIDSEPAAIFVNAMDTSPLAPSTDIMFSENEEAFRTGLLCVAKLREDHVYLCRGAGSPISKGAFDGVRQEEFTGPHPAGTVGLHIHLLYPVHRERVVWHIGIQDVIAIGKLFTTGHLDVERIVSLAGPAVKTPRLFRTRVGASTDALVAGELNDGENRVVSGSVLNGRTAQGDIHGYLGRFHQQVTALAEGREREFLGWIAPGSNKYSIINTFISKLVPNKQFAFTTATHGSERAMVPIGMYEKVMAMDLLPTFLLRALVMGDLERAERLGCLELDEEDLALCTFVCPGKYEYGPHLRQVLTQIEKEG